MRSTCPVSRRNNAGGFFARALPIFCGWLTYGCDSALLDKESRWGWGVEPPARVMLLFSWMFSQLDKSVITIIVTGVSPLLTMVITY